MQNCNFVCVGKQACVYIQHVWVNMHERNETTLSQIYLFSYLKMPVIGMPLFILGLNICLLLF